MIYNKITEQFQKQGGQTRMNYIINEWALNGDIIVVLALAAQKAHPKATSISQYIELVEAGERK
jgi:hypothetical protein